MALEVFFDDVGHQAQRRDIHDRRDRRLRRGEGADVEVPLGDEAVYRRDHVGIGKVDAQLLDPRFGLRELRVGQVERGHRRGKPRLGIVQRLFGQQLASVQIA